MAAWSFVERTIGWNTLTSGISVLVLVVLTMKLISFMKYYTFYHNLEGSLNRSYLWGHIKQLPSSGEGRIKFGRQRMDRGNGRYSCFWFGPFYPTITVYHPHLVKKVLRASAPKAQGMGSAYNLAMPWIGEGLIVANDQRWARARRLLTPAFHFDILKDYIHIYNEASDRLFIKLDKLAETGESFDICPLVTLFALEVILRCALGFDGEIQRKGHPYALAARQMTEFWCDRVRKPWLWPAFLCRLTAEGKTFFKHCDYVHKFAEEIIERRREELNKGTMNKERHLDFIDILLSAKDEDGKSMTTEEIRNEVDTLMFAGHDSTATSIPWIMYTLAKHPEYQERVQEEVGHLMEGRDNPHVQWQDLSKFEMLLLCIKETLRLYPTVPFIQRDLDIDQDFDGLTIPAGTPVNVAIVHLHRNREIWDEPDEFRPERFLAENKSTIDSFSFIPFAAGARNCIGQNFALNEEKVVLSRLFQRYNIKIAPDTEPPQRNPSVVLKADNGIWLRLERR